MAKELKKRKRRLKKVISTQSFCPVLDVMDGIVFTRDRKYVKIMEFAPINFDLRPVGEQDAIVAVFAGALRTFPRRVHIKVTSERANVSAFIEDMYKRMAVEDNHRCRQQQLETIRLIEESGNMEGTAHRFFLSFAYEEPAGLKRTLPFAEIRAQLERDAFAISAALDKCGNSVVYDGSDTEKTLEILYDLACRSKHETISFLDHKARVDSRFVAAGAPGVPPVQNYISPDTIRFGESPNYIQVDDSFIAYCYIPGRSYPTTQIGGWLQDIYNYMPGVDCDVFLQKEDVAKVQNRLRFWIKNNKIKDKNTEETDNDYEAVASALAGGRFIKQAIANGDDVFHFAILLTIHAKSVKILSYKYRLLRNHFQRLDLSLRRCSFRQLEAYRDAVPLADCDKDFFTKAKRNAPSSQLGSIYPFTAYELLERGGFFLGENMAFGSPVFLNNFNTTKYENANMLIMGPSGSGKTYALQTILMRMRQMGERVFIVAPQKAHEYRAPCQAIGGTYIRLAHGSNQHINVMEIRPRKNVAERRRREGSQLTMKVQKVRTFCSMLVPDMSPQEAQIVDAAILRTYNKFGITTDNESLWDPDNPEHYKPMPILQDLHEELGNSGEEAKRVYSVMSLYVTGSVDAFNHVTDIDADNHYVVFDVQDLTEEMLPLGMFVALDFIMDACESDTFTRKVVAIDEMWYLIRASRQSMEFVRWIFKIIRGLNGAAVGATQDVFDITNSEVGSAVINNTKIKILLQMDRREASAVSEVVDLTSSELDQLMRAGDKIDRGKALFIANDNHVFIRVRASAIEHKLITTDPAEVEKMEQMEAGQIA